jgi:outer membrane receptor for ferrienterochelin and colicin
VGTVNLVASYISYTSKKSAEVRITGTEPTQVNVLLEPSTSKDLQTIDVVVTLNKENNTALVLQQKNSSAVTDGISAETIRKTPDRNTGDVLKRVSGVTIQDDKFVVVRGLNERYNASYINNSPLPSTEPDRKAFAFDLFPANMLDNLVIIKTATPDQPSEFAGGIIQVTTRSIPEKNFLALNTGTGYNTITTGKTKIIYEGGKYDKLGFDDGSRNLPAAIPGIHEKSTWITTPAQGAMAKNFKNDWGYSESTFAPNTNFQLSAGLNIKRKEQDFFGVLFSLGYYSTQSLYSINRNEYEELSGKGDGGIRKPIESQYTNVVNQSQRATGSLLNFSLKPNSNTSISIKNLFSGITDDKFITIKGTNNFNEENIIRDKINVRYFSANRILSSQLNSEHYLPEAKIKINFNLGISSVQRTVPNMRFSAYGRYDRLNPFDPSEGPNARDTLYKAYVGQTPSVGPDYAGFRVYSALNEKLAGSRLDVSKDFRISEDTKINVKAGVFYQQRSRQFNMRRFGLSQYSSFQGAAVIFDDSLLYVAEDQIFSQQNMGVTSYGRGGFKLIEDSKPDDNYFATSHLYAGYLMGDFKLTDKWRIITGARYESYAQKLSVDYKTFDSIYVENTVNDLLPSLNLVYNLAEKSALRFSWYKTLNRAEFRELAAANWYDPETRLSIAGNPDLQRAAIQNFDLRYEAYPGRGQLLTISGFYKYFNSPIERYMYQGSTIQVYFKNANFAHVYGSELEYRVNLGAILKKDSVPFLNNLNVFSNLSLIKSLVNVAGIDENVADTRAMQGQAPYIINGGISYVDTKNNYSITGMINRVGTSIYVVGNSQVLNRYVKPRTVIDLQLTKSFFKNKLDLRLNVRDLLHQDLVYYYKSDESRKKNTYQEGDYLNIVRNYGSTFSFAAGYKF